MTRAPDAAPFVHAVEHTADAGFEVEAPTLPVLFERAALALVGLTADVAGLGERTAAVIAVEAADLDALLHDFLGEILLCVAVRNLLPGAVEVEAVSPTTVRARVAGEPIDAAGHRLYRELKAVTYHQLAVEQRGAGWWARVIVDV